VTRSSSSVTAAGARNPSSTNEGRGSTGTCGALVIGGAHGSLSVIRSLGRHGIPACFLTDDHVIAKFSRYTRSTFHWLSPDRPQAVEDLLHLAARHHLEGWVLVPGGDAEARLISQNHQALSSVFRVITPPWEVLRFANDKRLTYERAAELGIDHPWSYYPQDRDDLTRLECPFPLILKPTVRQQMNAFTQAKAWRVDDREALLARYEEAVSLVGKDSVVIQELIPGTGLAQFSYAAVWNEQGPVASLVAQRTRQYPITFGYTSTYVRSIEEAEIEELATRFLRSIGYTGMVEVEFKFDSREGKYKILDVNARTWTWNGLGRLAGVDFPLTMFRLAMAETVPEVRGRAGVAWMHLSRDAVAAIQEMWAGTLSPLQYLRSWGVPIEFAAFAADDPLPGVIDLPLALQRMWAKGR
jgi:predicted ATP-grasp superfamily ATP-dependent carboligase